MEKVHLIDFTLEDDNLLSSTTTPDDSKSWLAGDDSPLAATVVNADSHMRAKEQESIDSGSMERSEDKMPAAVVLQPSAVHGVLGIDAKDALQDGQKPLEQENHLNGSKCGSFQELRGMERGVRGVPYLLGKKSTSARTSNKLRKSLAWDKAFSTNEGVLDVDELPLVDNSPRRPQELRPLDILNNHRTFSPLLSVLESVTPSATAVDRAEGITSSSGQDFSNSVTFETESTEGSGLGVASSDVDVEARASDRAEGITSSSGQDLLNSVTFKTESSEGNGLGVESSDLDINASKFDSKSSAPGGGIVMADMLKGTRLRVPSAFTGRRGKRDMLTKPVSVPQSDSLRRCKSSTSVIGPSSASSAFSKKVSSVSKKVKDTLGMVLPGSFSGPAKHLKVNEDRNLHQGGAAKNLRIPLGQRLDVIREDVDCPSPKPVARSKSRRVFSGNSLDVNMVRQKDSQVDENNQEAYSTIHLGHGFKDPNLKDSSKDKDEGSSFKQCTENKSPNHTQISSVIPRKRSERAGFQVPSVQNSNHVGAAQSRKGLSSGLRLPSPKIGFFNA